jgi:hypothetical protein
MAALVSYTTHWDTIERHPAVQFNAASMWSRSVSAAGDSPHDHAEPSSLSYLFQ